MLAASVAYFQKLDFEEISDELQVLRLGKSWKRGTCKIEVCLDRHSHVGELWKHVVAPYLRELRCRRQLSVEPRGGLGETPSSLVGRCRPRVMKDYYKNVSELGKLSQDELHSKAAGYNISVASSPVAEQKKIDVVKRIEFHEEQSVWWQNAKNK